MKMGKKNNLMEKLEACGYLSLLDFISGEVVQGDVIHTDLVLDIIDDADDYIYELEDEIQALKKLLGQFGIKQVEVPTEITPKISEKEVKDE